MQNHVFSPLCAKAFYQSSHNRNQGVGKLHMSQSPPHEYFITKNDSRTTSKCYNGFITIAYTLSAFAFICGILQLSQSLTYVEQVCQVKSHDVVPLLIGSYWRPSWQMTVTDRSNRALVLNDGVIVGSNSYSSAWRALIVARKKKVITFKTFTS